MTNDTSITITNPANLGSEGCTIRLVSNNSAQHLNLWIDQEKFNRRECAQMTVETAKALRDALLQIYPVLSQEQFLISSNDEYHEETTWRATDEASAMQKASSLATDEARSSEVWALIASVEAVPVYTAKVAKI